MPFSLRLDPETEALLRRLAKARGRSKSAVVREAVEHYGQHNTPPKDHERTALDVVRPFIGIVATGDHSPEDTHTKYRKSLRRKASARRSG
jgi:predicted transcriptional regulator